MNSTQRVHCTHERHAPAILAIFNEAIVNSTALYDYQPRPLESMKAWFDTKQQGNFPVIGLEDSQGQLLAFGSYGTFRAWPAYKYTAEHSVYVHRDHRGRGLGLEVMRALIESARQRDLHALVGGIDATNTASIALHQRLACGHPATGGIQVGALAGPGVVSTAAGNAPETGGRLSG